MTNQEQKKIEQALTRLVKVPEFMQWLSIMRDMREAAIEGMEGANTEKLHQIAGAIAVYNAILGNAKAYAALEKQDREKQQ